jgi:hypothetical protein
MKTISQEELDAVAEVDQLGLSVLSPSILESVLSTTMATMRIIQLLAHIAPRS